MQYILYLLVSAFILASCSHRHPSVPSQFTAVEEMPRLLPDYADVVIPPNIAPLNFAIDEPDVTVCVAKISYPGGTLTFGEGNKVLIDEKDWHEMLESARGDRLNVELYALRNGQWVGYPAFSMTVANDSIDPYIAYRLIPPSYTTFEKLSLCQRNVETFEEQEIYNNQMIDNVKGGHCINCHAFQNYHTDRMQFHVRAEYGGTMIFDHGNAKMVDMRRNDAISAGVYPAWHPWLNLIVYSMNMTYQNFHTTYNGKVEVQDSQGGMMLYDNDHDEVKVICKDNDQLPAFPTWSPDGEYLYYATAHFEFKDTLAMEQARNANYTFQHELIDRYTEVEYDIVRRKFDAGTLTFGEVEMVWEASAEGQSATVPRISPDGRYLLVGLGDYGVFHIWHPESDLFVADLTTLDTNEDGSAKSDSLRIYPLTDANSPCAESFHNWSSNGRWILFESRRRDSNYTRLYFSYFDRDGKAHKAFELPQQDPDYELLNLKSYNIPEFMVEPVKTTPQGLARVIKGNK